MIYFIMLKRQLKKKTFSQLLSFNKTERGIQHYPRHHSSPTCSVTWDMVSRMNVQSWMSSSYSSSSTSKPWIGRRTTSGAYTSGRMVVIMRTRKADSLPTTSGYVSGYVISINTWGSAMDDDRYEHINNILKGCLLALIKKVCFIQPHQPINS